MAVAKTIERRQRDLALEAAVGDQLVLEEPEFGGKLLHPFERRGRGRRHGAALRLEGLVGDRRDGPVHDAKGGGRWGVFLFQRDDEVQRLRQIQDDSGGLELRGDLDVGEGRPCGTVGMRMRSEEHTSELQSLAYLVCRLLLEKKKKN